LNVGHERRLIDENPDEQIRRMRTALLPLINVSLADAAHRLPMSSAGIIIRVSLTDQAIF
jgi:hypothetical protein